MPSPRYADHRYGGALRGDPPTGYSNSDVPWHVGPTRVDGLVASEPLGPPVVPGRERTYECRFLPDASHDAREHVRRFETVAAALEYAPDVLSFDPPGGQVFYREQYDGPSALVRVAPLQADHDATYVDGESPPGRDSLHAGRWAVISGGTASAPVPERACTLQLETVTVGSTADYPTRESMIAAAQRNGF